MVVAGGITSVAYEETVVYILLGLAAGQITLALLGNHIGDITLLRGKVVAHCGGFVVGALVVEHRLARNFAERVGTAYGKNGVVAQIHLDFGGVELDVAVAHLSFAIHVRRIAADYDHRVRRFEVDSRFEVSFIVSYTPGSLQCRRYRRHGCRRRL